MPSKFEVSAPSILLFLGPRANIQGTRLEICAVGTGHQFFVFSLARPILEKPLPREGWGMVILCPQNRIFHNVDVDLYVAKCINLDCHIK